MIKKIRHYYGAYRVTAAGNMVLTSPSREGLFTFSPELRHCLEDRLALLCSEYPFISYEIKENLMETEISLFAYRSACADPQFLDHWRQWLAETTCALTSDGTCIVTIQGNGSLGYQGIVRDFRLLNKGVDVQYKFTAEHSLNLTDQIVSSPFVRMALTVLLVLVLAWCAYDELAPAPPSGTLF